ncbi:FAD-dependent oxidoreductase [Streptosporangium lutulentum]
MPGGRPRGTAPHDHRAQAADRHRGARPAGAVPRLGPAGRAHRGRRAGTAQGRPRGRGRRVVVSGTGPFLLPVAAGLADAGAKVLGVHEANGRFGLAAHPLLAAGKAGEALGYGARLARHGVPYHGRQAVIAAHGDVALTHVTVARLDSGWRPISTRTVECDTLAYGYGFVPQLDLPVQLGCATRGDADGSPVVAVDAGLRTSVPGVYAAGSPPASAEPCSPRSRTPRRPDRRRGPGPPGAARSGSVPAQGQARRLRAGAAERLSGAARLDGVAPRRHPDLPLRGGAPVGRARGAGTGRHRRALRQTAGTPRYGLVSGPDMRLRGRMSRR